MDYSEFTELVSNAESPVVLLEGTREVPPDQAPKLTALASHLARSFPTLRFRTGNAKGSDEAFAKGIADVDPTRLEFVLPYSTHRSNQRPAESTTLAMAEVATSVVKEVIDATIKASPQHERVAVNYGLPKVHPRQRATAQLILRDTLKVLGNESMKAPVAGVFFVHAADPDRGGTGHTIRVCRTQGVPVINQFDWLAWPF